MEKKGASGRGMRTRSSGEGDKPAAYQKNRCQFNEKERGGGVDQREGRRVFV